MKWSKEKCREEALKYETKIDFQKYSNSAYSKSIRNNWICDICSHMKRPYNKNIKWTFEKCREEALKYNTNLTGNCFNYQQTSNDTVTESVTRCN